MQSAINAARVWVQSGAAIIPVPHRTKAPVLSRWQDLRITIDTLAQYFNGQPQNIGLLVGKPSGDLVDIDLDVAEAVIAAPYYLPKTAVFGRPGNPDSHYLCLSQDAVTHQWSLPAAIEADKGKQMVVELRSTGCQTVVPPSTHVCGEAITWSGGTELPPPAAVIDKADLFRRIQQLASAAIISRYWKAGIRHHLAMALAGAMLNSGWTLEEVELLVKVVCAIAKDDELKDRLQAVQTTAGRLATGLPATGIPTMGTLLGEPILAVLKRPDWLGLADAATLDFGAAAPAAPATPEESEETPAGWLQPQPLVTKVAPEAYPVDALPDTIRAAVEEVAGFVKAPLPLVAASALAALSVACQAHVDVKRAEKLQGPTGLYLLTIADSGERKSTCDGFFTSEIRKYDKEQVALTAPAVKDYESSIAAWEAVKDGILAAIKEAAKKAKQTSKLETDLAEHRYHKPVQPRVPRLLRGDDTPEALAWSLAKMWPSSGLIASEAGVVFGGHGMGKDSVMRNLSLLNILWDGGTLPIGRKSTDSFIVEGARLTMGLMVQEQTLREYFSKTGALARGCGFLSRFLVTWPASTQGTRFFEEAPENWPYLTSFHFRLAELLNQQVSLDAEWRVTPELLSLSPPAKAAWVEFHNAIELELGSGGEFFDVRDVAAKTADNAARLAALFHLFSGSGGSNISKEAFEGASLIVAWHLNESLRFFGEMALPVELVDAARLDKYLLEYCREKQTHMVGKNHVRQYGPLRDVEKLDVAIQELAALDRLILRKDGKRLTLLLNPALVGETPCL